VPSLSFTVAQANETRFIPGAYDAVLGFNILHLVDGWEAAIKRAHSLLIPESLLITKTPCLKQMNLFIRMAIPMMQFFGKAPFVAVFDHKALEQAIRNAGFEIEESRTFEGAKNVQYIVARKVQA